MGTSVNMPKKIEVVVNSVGEPGFVVRNHGKLKVARIQNRWRIDDEWWRSEISRIYYELALSDGPLITVFQDLVSGNWYKQRD